MIRKEMVNCVEEMFHELDRWLSPEYSTYGHPSNTFSGEKHEPVMFDYIFRRTNSLKRVKSWTSSFELPLFKAKMPTFQLRTLLQKARTDTCPFKAYESRYISEENGQSDPNTKEDVTVEALTKNTVRSKRTIEKEKDISLISFSDHEAITASIYIQAQIKN